MKLKPQPPKPPRAPRSAGRRTRAARAKGRGPLWWRGRQARRPGPSLRRRVAARLPRAGRILAGLAALAVTGVLVLLLAGPWLRVSEVAWAGERFTAPQDLERLLTAQRGQSVLALDTASIAARIEEELPTVATARVEAGLLGGLHATVVEHPPALVWHTPRLWLFVAEDGTLFASLPASDSLPPDLAELPAVDDVRFAAHLMRVGDVVPAGLFETARRLTALDPAALGSTAGGLSLRLEAQYGFVLVSADNTWRIAFGYSGHDPEIAAEDVAIQIDRQVAAVRTLFAAQVEAGIGWVDARNPGKVYFRAKG